MRGPLSVEPITIAGRVTGANGQAIKNVHIEIWQADQHGCYHHPNETAIHSQREKNFTYFGQTQTDADGHYKFSTISPKAYNDDGDWRTSHIHFNLYRS